MQGSRLWISPDVGIALDVTARATPQRRHDGCGTGQGGGHQSQGFQPYLPSGSQNYMVKIAEEKASVPDGSVEAGGTDSGAIQMTKSGIPAESSRFPAAIFTAPAKWSTLVT